MEEQKSEGFFSHVFNFDDNSRHELSNVMQYSVLATIFAVLIIKTTTAYAPVMSPEKQVAALTLEVVLQLVGTFLLVVFTHRIIEFIPTASGVKYSPQNLTSVILPVLVVLFSVNSALTDKITAIWDKLTGEEKKPPPKAQSNAPPPPPLLPRGNTTNNPIQADPDFNSMFAGPANPLVNANSPADFEPLPANSGGMMF